MQLIPNTLLQGGKYKILRTLGQGGFGITYEAEQVNLHRRVAVKEFFMKDYCDREPDSAEVSMPSSGSKELVARFKVKFLKEALLIASLDDAHIVRIHDVFEENGTAYYVMEYLSGGSLSEKCNSGPLSESTALFFIREIAAGLEYLHTLPEPMNHLDIKPSNVLLNKKGNPVLIDFGISKRYDAAGGQTSSTPVGVSLGYSPPEQYKEGGVNTFSPTTDIYSLGATLYKLVTGETPPHASDVLMDGLPSLPESLSGGTKKAIIAAMQPRRKDRPQSIGEFLTLLDETEEKEIVESHDDGLKMEQYAEQDVEETVIAIGPRAVDLGLPSGKQWADCNLGASRPEECGDYYAWGEIQSKTKFSWENYRFRQEGTEYSDVIVSKYGVDGVLVLQPEDDPANIQFGAGWHVPSEEDFQELFSVCRWVWLDKKAWRGYQILGPNRNAIFLPVSGYSGIRDNYGCYWTSERNRNSPVYAKTLNFDSLSKSFFEHSRSIGLPVRAVK